jgi:hypothetical protein
LLAEARQAVADTSIHDYARKQCNVSGVLDSDSPKRKLRFGLESTVSTPSTIWADRHLQAFDDRLAEPAEVSAVDEEDAVGLSLHGELISDAGLHKLQHRLKLHADLFAVAADEAVHQ